MSNPLADARAILDQDRLFAQHQAALTLLQSRVPNPKVKDFHWLDPACGRGQIIVHLDGNLTPAARSQELADKVTSSSRGKVRCQR